MPHPNSCPTRLLTFCPRWYTYEAPFPLVLNLSQAAHISPTRSPREGDGEGGWLRGECDCNNGHAITCVACHEFRWLRKLGIEGLQLNALAATQAQNVVLPLLPLKNNNMPLLLHQNLAYLGIWVASGRGRDLARWPAIILPDSNLTAAMALSLRGFLSWPAIS